MKHDARGEAVRSEGACTVWHVPQLQRNARPLHTNLWSSETLSQLSRAGAWTTAPPHGKCRR